ncbi:MAG TPA: protocatechuate 3,4-dioxygenase subunit alpha [Terriglobales bacterium]|nr:protocatechuate 3,4-dioxygenase subunit alpha [Terriglobales bacterium]
MQMTPSQTVGPFFSFGLTTEKCCVRNIVSSQAKGERVILTCRVLDGDGVGLPDAMVEIWQADAEGIYKHPDDPRQSNSDPACTGFGRMGTDESGICEFETIKPGRVAGSNGQEQAPHLNVAIFARGMLKQLYTRIYFADDPANQNDPALALVPLERRDTLMAKRDSARSERWSFDLRLQGERETVFFDL